MLHTINEHNKSIWFDRTLFFLAILGTLHFMYFLIIDNYSGNLDNLFGTQTDQHRSELKKLMDENIILLAFDLLSLLVFILFILIFVLKKIFLLTKSTGRVEENIGVSDWAYAIFALIAPFLVCFIIHACTQSIYRAELNSENLEKFQQRKSILNWSVLATLIIGYAFALKFMLKHPFFKSKTFLIVIIMTINLIGLFAFNLGIYLFFDGPFP